MKLAGPRIILNARPSIHRQGGQPQREAIEE